MNYQVVIDYINRKYGKDVKKSVMYDRIAEWRHWLEGNVKGFHEFHKKMDLNDDTKSVKLHRHKTNMLLKGSEDWASILLNEKTRIVIEDEKSQEFVMGKDEISGVFGTMISGGMRMNWWRLPGGAVQAPSRYMSAR